MEETCATCFKIVCRQCQWEPNAEQLQAITDKILTACPVCGWIPGA